MGKNGAYPYVGVTLDSSGNLFGTTSEGGANGNGVLYEIAHGSNALTTLWSFTASDVPSPDGSVLLDASGDVYGIGGIPGTLFEYQTSTSTLGTVASADGITAVAPGAAPTIDASGNLYGTSAGGGAFDAGDVFEIAKGTNTITAVASFDGTDGAAPLSPATLDGSGDLFGTTGSAGAGGGGGTVWEIASGSNSITALASFDIPGGQSEYAGVTLDPAGNIFGTTEQGGAYGKGTVFEIASGTNTLTTLVSFDGTDGGNPEGGVTLNVSGDLFGTTSGTVFEIAKGSANVTTLATFDSATGDWPYGPLTMDPSGNFYGTTSEGGPNRGGTIFEIPNGSSTLNILASLPYGAESFGGLVLDPAGNLFGTTQFAGSAHDGSVFELSHGSSTITTLASLSPSTGTFPTGGVALDAYGNIYGTASQNGPGFDVMGSVFKLTANAAISLTTTGPNPSTANQPLAFTATVQPTVPSTTTVPDGETVMLEDASNHDTVVATGTLRGGSATLTVQASTLLAGTHNLIAVYGGDANFAASESAPYTQTVQVVATNVQVNGNLPSLAGAQRSMVDSILYTFSEPVNISGDAATLAIHTGQTGTLPTSLAWAAINPNADGSSTEWAVTFSGNGVVGESIANGVYDITLNPTDVTSDANPSVAVQPRATDTFYRLFGDINGDGVVNASDNFQLKTALSVYNAAFDYNDDGTVNAADNFQFKNSMSLNFSSSGIVYSI